MPGVIVAVHLNAWWYRKVYQHLPDIQSTPPLWMIDRWSMPSRSISMWVKAPTLETSRCTAARGSTASYASAVIATAEMSVCLSVPLSVRNWLRAWGLRVLEISGSFQNSKGITLSESDLRNYETGVGTNWQFSTFKPPLWCSDLPSSHQSISQFIWKSRLPVRQMSD